MNEKLLEALKDDRLYLDAWPFFAKVIHLEDNGDHYTFFVSPDFCKDGIPIEKEFVRAQLDTYNSDSKSIHIRSVLVNSMLKDSNPHKVKQEEFENNLNIWELVSMQSADYKNNIRKLNEGLIGLIKTAVEEQIKKTDEHRPNILSNTTGPTNLNYEECVKFVRDYAKGNPIYYAKTRKSKPELLTIEGAFYNLAFYNAGENTTTFFQKGSFIKQVNDFINDPNVDTLVFCDEDKPVEENKEPVVELTKSETSKIPGGEHINWPITRTYRFGYGERLLDNSIKEDVSISGLLQTIWHYQELDRLLITNHGIDSRGKKFIISHKSGRLTIKYFKDSPEMYISEDIIDRILISCGMMYIDISDWEIQDIDDSVIEEDVDISGLLRTIKYYKEISRLSITDNKKIQMPFVICRKYAVIGYDSGRIYIKLDANCDTTYISPIYGVDGIDITEGYMTIDISNWEISTL